MAKTKTLTNERDTFRAFREDGIFANEWIINGLEGNDTLAGNRKDDVINGGSGADFMQGRGGDDTMNGGTGADFMAGGSGADTYFVDSERDVVQEGFFQRDLVRDSRGRVIRNRGIDTVIASIDYTLTDFVENLTLDGNAVNGTGNDLNNIILGNSLANTLVGGDGDDTIRGGRGDDTIRGGFGNDRLFGDRGNDLIDGRSGGDEMQGGSGHDTYVVNSVFDRVIEASNRGIDTVRATLDTSRTAYVLPNQVENLILERDKIAHGTGNALDNEITGNRFFNRLRGGSGRDTLRGGGSGDELFGNRGSDFLFGESGGDELYGGTANDRLDGGDGNDLLVGFGGSTSDTDTMIGGAGADIFQLGDASQVFYTTGSTHGRILDFNRAEGDKIAINGSAANYTLEHTTNFIGQADQLDTRIFFNGDLIGIVADTALSLTTDFVTATQTIRLE